MPETGVNDSFDGLPVPASVLLPVLGRKRREEEGRQNGDRDGRF